MIRLDDGLWSAPQNIPIAAELRANGWRLRGDKWITQDIARVVPFFEHIEESLKQRILDRGARVEHSRALKASDNFQPIVPEGRKLFDFQAQAVERILSLKNTLLAEDAGLGKSAIMIAVANLIEPKRTLIVCPAVAKYNWFGKEWPKWSCLSSSIGVVEGDEWSDTDVVIINYDLLQRHKPRLNSVHWDYLILDESRRLKNPEAMRTKLVLGGTMLCDPEWGEACGGRVHSGKVRKFYIPEIPYGKRVFADATAMDRPRDLWTMAQSCDPGGLGRDYKHFATRYCAAYHDTFGWHDKGASNLEELGATMRATFMIRHKPEEVLDLPPMREEIYLLPPIESVRAADKQFIDDNLDALLSFSHSAGAGLTKDSKPEEFIKLLGESLYDDIKLIGAPKFAAMLTQYSKLRLDTGMAKVPGIIDYIRMRSRDGEEPLIVFTYHRDVLAKLREAFPDHAYIMGGMGSAKRMTMVDRFQNGETNLLLGQIDACGEAVTLTRARIAAIAETDWRGTALYQARKRIHRITQEHPVLIEHLCAPDCFDYVTGNVSMRKLENMALTLDSGGNE